MSTQIAQKYDYIVIGCGGVGSATLYWLAKRAGKRVLGLEQFDLAHNHGGSQDHSRVIRLAYHNADYIPLIKGSYEAWSAAEKESGIQLVYKTGGIDTALKGTDGYRSLEQFSSAMDSQNVPYERLEGESIRRRFPQFNPTSDWVALYQKDTGLVDAALGNAVHIQLARKHGATILDNAIVTKVERQGNLTKVCTNYGYFLCKKVIVTAGAWMNDVLTSVGVHIPLTVTQEQVSYFATPNMKEFSKDRCPVFCFFEDSLFYTIPIHGNTGFKIGIDAVGPEVSPETRTYEADPVREKRSTEFIAKHCPRALGPILYTKTCLYAMTPDRNFVIDNCRKTGHPDVIFCCGAGHAYKFAAVLGQILTQLATEGKTTFDIAPFNMYRAAITDQNYPKAFQIGAQATEKTGPRDAIADPYYPNAFQIEAQSTKKTWSKL